MASGHSFNRDRGAGRRAARCGPSPAGPGQHRRHRYRRRRHRREAARKPASGSSPRRPNCRRSTPRSSSPTTRAATSFPICRRPTTASGCAATASSIRRRCRRRPASTLDLTAVPAPNASAAAQIYPPIYWFSMLHVPKKNEFPLDRRSRARASGSTSSRAAPASPATRSARRARARSASSSATSSRTRPTPGRGGSPPAARRRSWRATSAGSTPTRRSTCSATGPTGIAGGELPFAKPRAAAGHRAQRRRHAVGLGPSDSPICTTRSRPTAATRGSTPTARSTARRRTAPTSPDPRSGHQHRERSQASGARPEDAEHQGQLRSRASPYWGDKPIWDSQTINHNLDDGREGPRLVDLAHPAARRSGLLQGGLGASVGEGVPAQGGEPPTRRVYDPKTQEVHADRHLLPDAPSQLRERRQPARSGPAPAWSARA